MGLALAYFCLKWTGRLEFGAMGALIGITISEVLSLIHICRAGACSSRAWRHNHSGRSRTQQQISGNAAVFLAESTGKSAQGGSRLFKAKAAYRRGKSVYPCHEGGYRQFRPFLIFKICSILHFSRKET